MVILSFPLSPLEKIEKKGRSPNGEERLYVREREISKPNETATRPRERHYARGFERTNISFARFQTRLDGFSLGLVRPGPRARARDFISHPLPARTTTREKKILPTTGTQSVINQKKKMKKSFATSLTYRRGDSLRLRFSAHRRDGDASVRDLGDRGHVFNVRVFYFECGI